MCLYMHERVSMRKFVMVCFLHECGWDACICRPMCVRVYERTRMCVCVCV